MSRDIAWHCQSFLALDEVKGHNEPSLGGDTGIERSIQLGWGRQPRTMTAPTGAQVLMAPSAPPSRSWHDAVDLALAAPIGSKHLEIRLAKARQVAVIVPDETRKDVAESLLPHILPHLADVEVSVGVATGKHPPCAGPPGAWIHSAQDPALIAVGTTSRGTPVRYPRAVLEADLRIVLGEIRPHYFAGYAGGAKGLFPGVAGEDGIWINHELKAKPGARLGRVDQNPCRDDMEEAARMAGPAFLVNIIRGPDGGPVDAVAGDLVAAHREGVRRARRIFEVTVPRRTRTVVISDREPVTMNLYQACKLLPPAGAVLADGGTVVLAAECAHGLGPISVINDKIYRLGSVHSLPPRHRVILVTARPAVEVAPTFAEYAPSVEAALATAGAEDLTIIPYGGDLVPRWSGNERSSSPGYTA